MPKDQKDQKTSRSKPYQYRVSYSIPGCGHGLTFVSGENEKQARESFAQRHPGCEIDEIKKETK